MTKPAQWKNYLALHFAIFMWGAAGVSSKLMSIPSSAIVFYRSAIATCVLFVFAFIFYRKDHVTTKDRLYLMATGIILGLAWLCFFESIRLSTVSIGVVCLSIAPIFIVFLQALVDRQPIQPLQLIVACISLCGVLIMFGFERQHITGLLIGLVGAFIDAVYTIMTAKSGRTIKIANISKYQMLGSALVVMVMFILREGNLDWLALHQWQDVAGIFFLGILCSAVAMALYVQSIKALSGFTAAISLNLEALYGIMLALFLFGQSEILSLGFYCGALLLVAGVVGDGIVKNLRHPRITKQEK